MAPFAPASKARCSHSPSSASVSTITWMSSSRSLRARMSAIVTSQPSASSISTTSAPALAMRAAVAWRGSTYPTSSSAPCSRTPDRIAATISGLSATTTSRFMSVQRSRDCGPVTSSIHYSPSDSLPQDPLPLLGRAAGGEVAGSACVALLTARAPLRSRNLPKSREVPVSRIGEPPERGRMRPRVGDVQVRWVTAAV